MSTYIHMMSQGSALPGRPDVPGIGGVDLEEHTRVLSMYYDFTVGDGGTAIRDAARSQVSPVTIVKTVDLISPMLQEAMDENHRIDALIRVFANGPESEGGVVFQSHNITLVQARIVGIRVELPAYTFGAPEMFGQQPLEVLQQPLERVSLLPFQLTSTSLRENGSESTWVQESSA